MPTIIIIAVACAIPERTDAGLDSRSCKSTQQQQYSVKQVSRQLRIVRVHYTVAFVVDSRTCMQRASAFPVD